MEKRMLRFIIPNATWFLGILFLSACNSGTNPITPSGLTCEYVKQTPESFKNLETICSICYTKDSRPCIDHLTDHYPQGDQNAAITRYIQLWNDHFDKLIKDTCITFYQGDAPDRAKLLDTKINMTVTGTEDTKFSLGNIKYSLSAASFSYDKGQAYPNFANKKWGGGVLKKGNVQEEIKMRQSNALPWIAQAENAVKDHTEWCPDININNLDKNPVVMKLSIISDFDARGYGYEFWKKTKEVQMSFMTPRPNPEEIYSYAMAAPYLPKGSIYTQDNLENLFYAATTAFYYTMLAMDHDGKALEIHAGNWGAGAFHNSLKMTWAIQLLAIKTAYELFQAKTQNSPEVLYVYDANKDDDLNIIKEAYSKIKGYLIAIKPSDYLFVLKGFAESEDSWQVQKK